MAGKEGVLAGERLGPHGALDDVGVELDAAIFEEAGEAVPVPEAVADDAGDLRLARHSCKLAIEEALERVNERGGFHLPGSPPFCKRSTSTLAVYAASSACG